MESEMNLDGIEQLSPALQRIFRSVAETASERERKATCVRTNTPYRRQIGNYTSSPAAIQSAAVIASKIGQDEERPQLLIRLEDALTDRLIEHQRNATSTNGGTQLKLDL